MHWSGLLTSTEVDQKIATYVSQSTGEIIERYITAIKLVQDFTPSIRTMEMSEVVDTNVERFFRLQLGYTVVHSTVGQTPGKTLMTKISW